MNENEIQKDDLAEGAVNRKKRAMTLEIPDVDYKFNDLVRSHTDKFFGKKHQVIKDILAEYRQQSHEINTLEDAKLVLEKVMKQEQMLSHALSRTQMMLSEKEDMFEKAVDVGEHYKNQMEDLCTQMEEYEAHNSLLRANLKSMNEKHIILKETIDDQQMEIASLIKAIKLKDSGIANSSANSAVPAKSELSKNLGLEKIEGEILKTIKQLHRDLESEKLQRNDAEEKKASALSQLTDIKKELKSSRAKVRVLERTLEENTKNYRNAIFSLTAENAHLEERNTELVGCYKDLEENLVHQMSSVGELTMAMNSSAEFTRRASRPLYEQMTVSRISLDNLHCANQDASVYARDRFMSFSKKKTERQAVATQDVIKEYLHVTAAIVKLHFPDVKTVSSKWLIDHVKNSPFYLYHDLMMNCMRQIQREEEAVREEEAKSKPTAPIEKIGDDKQSRWMGRFLKLTQGRAKTRGKYIKV